jgi:hypothetical protein
MATTTIAMWLCNNHVYDTHKEAIAAANKVTYSKKEEDVQFILDEYIISPYSYHMGEAIAYLESRGLLEGRLSGPTTGDPYSIYSVSGLKAALGEQGWVEFLTILELNCKVSAVTYTPSSAYRRTVVGVWAGM